MLLELEHIAKSYELHDSEHPLNVLKDVMLQVDAGEAIAILGPSGSGKSTLLNIIGTLDRPTAGTIRLDGVDLSDYSDQKLATIRNQKIGFIFQMHHLLPQCTVLENVLLPTIPAKWNKEKQVIERAYQLLQRVGLQDHLYHRPGQLSGGECQRTAVVRALVNKPGLLLADEPTGSLDSITAEKLGQLLIELNQEEGVTLIVVTHSIDLARKMKKIYRIQKGILYLENDIKKVNLS